MVYFCLDKAMNSSIDRINEYGQVWQIWETYMQGIRLYLLKKVQDETTADELTQEVLLKIYNSCCSGKTLRNIRSWLFQIAHNVTVDHFKERQRVTNEVPDGVEVDEEVLDLEDAESIVVTMLDLIPEKYASVLRLYELEGVRQQEIADRLSISLPATKSRIQRARVMLRDQILKCYQFVDQDNGSIQSLQIKKNCSI